MGFESGSISVAGFGGKPAFTFMPVFTAASNITLIWAKQTAQNKARTGSLSPLFLSADGRLRHVTMLRQMAGL